MKTSLTKTEKRINSIVKQVTENSKTLDKLGKRIVTNIKADTLNGKSYNDKKFPPLAPSTIKHRRFLAKYNKVSADYSLNRSNATITGDLVKAIKNKVEKGKIVISAEGTHKRYRGKNKVYKATIKYSNLLNILWGLNRLIMGVSKESRKSVVTAIKREFRRSLRRIK